MLKYFHAAALEILTHWSNPRNTHGLWDTAVTQPTPPFALKYAMNFDFHKSKPIYRIIAALSSGERGKKNIKQKTGERSNTFVPMDHLREPRHSCHSETICSVLQRRRNARVSLWVLVAQQFGVSAWLAALAAQMGYTKQQCQNSQTPLAHPEKGLNSESITPGLLWLTVGFVLAGSALLCLLRLLQCLNLLTPD